jgi:hypothetical protein
MKTVAPVWISITTALTGAGIAAVAPAAVAAPDVASRAVQLMADFDPFGPFADAFNAASANATAVAQFFLDAPAATLQQIIVNQLGELGADPQTYLQDVGVNFLFAVLAGTFIDPDQDEDDLDFINMLSAQTLDEAHHDLQLGLVGAEPSDFPAPDEPMPALIDLLSSPASGLLIGELGPLISPIVALANSVQAAADDFGTDPTTAFQDLINIPAKVVDAYLNGTTVDLTALLPAIEQANILPLPDGASIDSLTLALGGLFSPGTTGALDGGVGGSIFNAIGLDISNVPGLGELDIAGVGVGPLAAMAELSQIIAQSIGWDGSGNPLDELGSLMF